MLSLFRALALTFEIVLSVPMRIARFLTEWVFFNPRLGPLRYLASAVAAYVAFDVVLVGTGSPSEPWATSLHAAQVAAPLLNVLLEDLSGSAKSAPMPSLAPKKRPTTRPVAESNRLTVKN